MGALLLLLQLVLLCLTIGNLVCFILVLIKMFQSGETAMGIVCIVTIFCGLGGLIAFILGWINVAKWRIQQVMMIWTGCVIGNILLYILLIAFGAASLQVQGQGMGPM